MIYGYTLVMKNEIVFGKVEGIKPCLRPKNDKLIYSIGSIAVIVDALMKIFHLPYAKLFLYFLWLECTSYNPGKYHS